MKYQLVFNQGGFSSVDYETDNYDQALEVKIELEMQMIMCGELDFYYIIKTVK